MNLYDLYMSFCNADEGTGCRIEHKGEVLYQGSFENAAYTEYAKSEVYAFAVKKVSKDLQATKMFIELR